MDHQRDGLDVSIHQTLFATYDNPMIVVDSADFDGTNDWMTRGAGLTGAADSKKGIFSVWLRLDGGDGVGLYIAAMPSNKLIIRRGFATDTFVIVATNSAPNNILDMNTAGAYLAGATWLHLLASWDLATAGARHIYVNDVADLSVNVFTDDTIDYTETDFFVGSSSAAGANLFNGCIAELYFAPGQYLDFSIVSNRRKFISASGKPVYLGTTGAVPTGTAPLVYQHLDDAEAVADFATNRGTGGDFTITGTLVTGSDSPSG